MRETDFIEQNKLKWSELEKGLIANQSKPDHISRQYIETVDDLSYARTHYANRLVRAYLNGVAQILSLKIYKSQRQYAKGLRKFWAVDLPLVMYHARYEFLLSFLILALSIGIGILSSMHDPDFARYILGEEYVAQTLANIEKGDPMAIYKDSGQAEMFFAITLNNILVSVRTYLLSLLFGAGTLLVIIYNGVMLGVFQYFFIERGLFVESFLTIWQHGVIEISCIVLAGAAGLVLARGILFPGTLSRINAFRYAGRKSLIIMLGLMPLLVYSGAIEALVTRYTEMHWVVRLSTILLSLAFVILYFVVYARRVAARLNIEVEMNLFLQPMQPFRFSYGSIESNPSIIWKGIGLIYHFRKVFAASILLLVGAGSLYLIDFDVALSKAQSLNGNFNGVALEFFQPSMQPLVIIAHGTISLFAILVANWFIWKNLREEGVKDISMGAFRSRLFIAAVVSSMFIATLMTSGWLFIPLALMLPVLAVYCVNSWSGNSNLFQSFRSTFGLIAKNYPKLIGLVLIQVFVTLLIFIIYTEFINPLLIQLLQSFFGFEKTMSIISAVINLTTTTTLIFFFFQGVFLSMGLSVFSLREVNTASSLKQSIEDNFPMEEVVLKSSLLSFKKFSKA